MNPAVNVILNANPAQLVAGMGKAGAAVGALGNVVEGVAGKVSTAMAKINQAINFIGTGLIGVGTAVEASLFKATTAAGDFEVGMRNVNTITKLNDRDLGSLSNTVLEMSTRMPQSAGTMAAGLYDIASSGFQAAEGLEILEQANIAATAGLTQTATASNAIVASLNAYGLGAGHARDVSDILFKTVDQGVITFEQLAGTVGEWIGIGASAGIQMDEMAAALATMTVNGVSADQAGVSLNRTVQAFINPSEQMTATVKALGYESGALMLQQLGLKGSIDAIIAATGGEITAMQDVFQNVNALQGVLALAAGNGQAYARIQEQITDEGLRAGAAQAAFAQQSKTLNAQMQILKNQLAVVVVQMGTYLLPVAKVIVGLFSLWADVLDSVPGPIKAIITYGMALSGVLSVILGVMVLTTLRARLLAGGLQMVFRWMSPALAARFASAMSGPLGMLKQLSLVIAGINIRGQSIGTWLGRIGMTATVAKVGVIGLVGGITAAAMGLQNLRGQAQAFAAEQEAKVDMTNYETLAASVNGLIDEYNRLGEVANQGRLRELGQNAGNFFKGLVSGDFSGPISEAQAKQAELEKTISRLMGTMDNWRANVRAMADQSGMTAEAIEQLASANGINLGESMDKVLPKLLAARDAAANYGGTLSDVDKITQMVADRTDSLSEALNGFLDQSGALGEIVGDMNDWAQASEEVSDSTYSAEEASIGLERANRRLRDITEQLNRAKARSIELDIQEAELNRDDAVLSHAEAVAQLAEEIDVLNRIRAAGGSPEAEAEQVRKVERARITARRSEMARADAQDELNATASGQRRSDEITGLELERRTALLEVARAQEAAAKAGTTAASTMKQAFSSMDVSLKQFTDKMEEKNKTADEWEDNLFKIVERGAPLEVVDQLVKMGVQGAPIVKKFADANDREFNRLVEIMRKSAERGTKEYAEKLQTGLSLAAYIAGQGGGKVTTLFMDELNKIPGLMGKTASEIQAAAQRFGFSVQVVPTGAAAGGGTPGANPGPGGGSAAPIAGPPNPNVPGSRLGAPDTPYATNDPGVYTAPSASDFGTGRPLTGTGGQPWAPYVGDPAWNVAYYDPGVKNQYGMAEIYSSAFGGMAGFFYKNAQGQWIWHSHDGSAPPAVSKGDTIPVSGFFATGGITDRRSIFGEAGREAAIPLWEGQPSRRTLGLLGQTAAELGYAVTRANRTMTGTGHGAAQIIREVIYVQVPERWVAPTQVDVHGTDPETAVAWGKTQARRKAMVRPGRGAA